MSKNIYKNHDQQAAKVSFPLPAAAVHGRQRQKTMLRVCFSPRVLLPEDCYYDYYTLNGHVMKGAAGWCLSHAGEPLALTVDVVGP